MDEWTEFLAVMDSITEEVSESHPKPDKFDLYQLINLSYIYILERDIIARAANNCYHAGYISKDKGRYPARTD